MGKIIWKSFEVGGDPDREAFLGGKLYNKLMDLQNVGWQIVRVDRNPISRAWSSKQKAYVDTIQYLIIAKAEEEEEKDVSQE